MPTIAEMIVKVEVPDFPPDELLISEDGVPLESDWHAVQIELLRELAYRQFTGTRDFFAGGNMFLYFNEQQLRDRDYRGPDFFFVWDATPTPLRPYWAIWKEGGRYPNVIIELLSPSTAVMDRTTKKDLYEQTFRTPEYFCYDPTDRLLEGWRLDSLTAKYQAITANNKGWLWSEQLGLWLGTWDGLYMGRDTTWVRFYKRDGTPVPTKDEALAVAQKLAADQQRRADDQQHQADNQRRRADAAEAELARLKAQLESNKD